MAEEKKIRFGVIGAGKIGTFHTRTLAKMQGVNLVGVCDPDSMRAQKLAWEHNCTPYTYPGVLSSMLGEKYDVRNFGVSGTTTMMGTDMPYMSIEV